MATVGLVFVSHSRKIAEGLVELARQMAPSVALIAAGGTDDDGIGTSYDRVAQGIAGAGGGAGVVVIGDLGSAILTAETAVDLLDEQPAGGIRVLDAPLIEGGVAAAVAAESGGDIEAVVRAASAAAGPAAGGEPAAPATPAADGDTRAEGVAVLADPAGLHARPAAELVRLVAGFGVRATVDGVDTASLLGLLAKGIRQGERVTVVVKGARAPAALAAMITLLESSP